LAAARAAEKEIRVVPHHKIGLYREQNGFGKRDPERSRGPPVTLAEARSNGSIDPESFRDSR